MHLFKSQWLQEAARRSFGPYREQGFDLRYARRRVPRRAPDDRDIAASNDDVAIDDVARDAVARDDVDTIAAAREILRRMADYDQAA
jgi:hypothetical protein